MRATGESQGEVEGWVSGAEYQELRGLIAGLQVITAYVLCAIDQ